MYKGPLMWCVINH